MSKVRSAMKWWSKCISMNTSKTASRNVAFKAARMSEFVLDSQKEDVTRKAEEEETGDEGHEEALNDVGYNAELYISNQAAFQD